MCPLFCRGNEAGLSPGQRATAPAASPHALRRRGCCHVCRATSRVASASRTPPSPTRRRGVVDFPPAADARDRALCPPPNVATPPASVGPARPPPSSSLAPRLPPLSPPATASPARLLAPSLLPWRQCPLRPPSQRTASRPPCRLPMTEAHSRFAGPGYSPKIRCDPSEIRSYGRRNKL